MIINGIEIGNPEIIKIYEEELIQFKKDYLALVQHYTHKVTVRARELDPKKLNGVGPATVGFGFLDLLKTVRIDDAKN
jgi:hypothetical protein